jgi:SAM-dependent methyltransferase
MSIKEPDVTGRDFYADYYRQELQEHAKWLEYGAVEKVNSIAELCSRNRIELRSLLELGCGTGAVIIECERRGLAADYMAVDYSPEAIQYLRSKAPRISCLVADITDPGFKLDNHFDVIVLSHVLEHLEQPLPFLNAIKERFDFRHLIVEVPLEDLFMPRVKCLFSDRKQNSAGHVQFFTETSFTALLHSAGLEIDDRRRFVPRMSAEAIRFMCRGSSSRLRTAYKLCTTCYLPRLLNPVWKQVWYAHLAALCTVKQPSDR